jgi:hypothetical protein
MKKIKKTGPTKEELAAREAGSWVMVGWHILIDGHEYSAQADGEGARDMIAMSANMVQKEAGKPCIAAYYVDQDCAGRVKVDIYEAPAEIVRHVISPESKGTMHIDRLPPKITTMHMGVFDVGGAA